MRVDDRFYNLINENDYRKDNVLVESKDFTYFKGNTHTLPSYTNTKWGLRFACSRPSVQNIQILISVNSVLRQLF